MSEISARLQNTLLRAVPCNSSFPRPGPNLILSRLREVLQDRGINVSFYHGSAAPRGKSQGGVPASAGVAVYRRREAHVSLVMRPVRCADLWLSDVPSHRNSSLTSHRGEAEGEGKKKKEGNFSAECQGRFRRAIYFRDD